MAVHISVVIPTYNRPHQLRACLAGLARADYARNEFEVVVVDDGGTVALESIIEPMRELLELRVERQRNAGPAAARNAGAAAAHGELLAFTDDDCIPDPAWLRTLAQSARENPGHLIGGSTINMLAANPCSAASQYLVSYLYEYSHGGRSGPGWPRFFASNNLAVPKAAFEDLSGFDVAFPLAAGEDRDFCDRWNERGLPMRYEPGARVLHAHRLTFASFWRQHWNYGRGAYHFGQARLRRGSPALKPESVSFYLNLLRYPLRHERLHRAAVQTALLGISQCANALGYFSERRARRVE